MDKEFYPNACIICSGTTNLRRCSRCQMISYCSEEHQLEHWPEHKELCKIISIMMKERGVSHLYEKFRGTDLHTWRKERMNIAEEAESRCSKTFQINDTFLFQFSRSCYVCYESRQKLLKNCSGCPAATFCNEHPSSPIHDKDCEKIRESFEIARQLSDRIEKNGLKESQSILTSVLHGITRLEPPISMEDFLLKFANSERLSIDNDLKFLITQNFTTIFTVFNALQKLEMSNVSKLTIHMENQDDCEATELWEALLHLLPNLKQLRILFIDPLCQMFFSRKNFKVCEDCKKKGKTFSLGFLACSYDECLRGNYKEPDLLVYTDIADSEKKDYSERKRAPGLLKLWSKTKCPLVTTTFIEEYQEEMKNTIKSTLGDVEFFYEGFNPFKSFIHLRNNYNRVGASNSFMIILKSKEMANVDNEKLQKGK